MKPRRFYFRTASIFGVPLKMGVPVFIGFSFAITGLTANAGDILRGGSMRSNKPSRANGGIPTPAATDAARASAKDTLARTSRTLKDIRNLQNAARNAAIRNGANNLGKNPARPNVKLPNVPNGIAIGGLNPTADPTKWTGADKPVQAVKNGKTTVTIKQTTQQALLEWQTMNVGKKTTLTFDQSKGGVDSGKWIAFNQIKDTSGNPTQILGNIKADGQVYLINTNGIIFGGSSQVNAKALTASSLPINTNLIERGILNNPDAQFLFSGLTIPAGANGTPAFVPDAPLSADGKYGDIVVQKGAILKSPTNSAKVGGRITLVGPNVTNEGTISTPDGQAILAAGLQVGFAAHAGSDPSLRGLDVYIGAVSDPVAGAYAGSVTHEGIIESARGAITLAGKEINQSGILESTTSVSLNGRIDLQAHYDAFKNPNFGSSGSSAVDPFFYRKSGTVRLGEESLIRILPEYESKETAIGSELALRSQINIAGKAIHLGERSVMFAPNAVVNITAGEWITVGGIPRFTQSAGQVYMDEDALIDVSGSFATAPVSQNIISVDLRGAELANSPLQREGNLRNKTIQVDIRDAGIYKDDMWLGTPLANISGFANLIQRTVGQLTVAGGTVNISAGKSVVMRKGARVDVSGGATKFEAGTVRTTLLITDGRLVDISEAKPDVIYDGIYDGTFTESNEKFGVANVYHGALAPNGGRFDPGSTEGAAGGGISITSASMALDGRLVGKTTPGERQRLNPPAGSKLTLSFRSKDTTYANLPDHSPSAPTIIFRGGKSGQEAAGDFELDVNGDPLPLAESRVKEVFLSPDLLSSDGFGELTVNNDDGDIIVPKGVRLEGAAGSSISLVGSNITIDGTVSSAGGKLSFNTGNIPLDRKNLQDGTTGLPLPTPYEGRGVFTLGSTGRVTVSGHLVDERGTGNSSALDPLFLDGGSIDIKSYSASLQEGGVLDVSGGAQVDPLGKVSYGDGGSLSISTGRDRLMNSLIGGRLSLGATLKGYSGAAAGSLTISAPAIQIGGSTDNSGVTLLKEDFFNQGGFGTFSLNGTGLASDTPGEYVTGVYIAPGAKVRPVVSGWVADTTGRKLELREITREEGIRTAGSLSFSAAGGIDPVSNAIQGRGDVILAEGASIRTDARGSVSFSGETVTLLGSVVTPGGTINAGGAVRFPSTDLNLLLPTTLIGKSAHLSAAGTRLLTENPFGLRQGQVLAGGSINITGNIVAERGAVLDVSGASGILDLPPSASSLDPATLNTLSGRSHVPVEIHSNGGRINLSGSRMLYSDATLIGRAGGSSAIGGSVSVSSGRFVAAGAESNTAEANLIVRQDGFLLPEDFVSRGIGAPLESPTGSALPGIGNFTISTFSSGGFDSLALNGNVSFEGNVKIKTPGALRVSSGGVIYGAGKVKLTAGYVSLGQAFAAPNLAADPVIPFTKTDGANVTTPYYFAPTFGSGGLKVNAGLIDIGNLSLQGIGSADFNATQGDIRGNGTLSAAGDLQFKAGQIYPTTAGSFKVFAHDYTSGGVQGKGSITVLAGRDRQLPLSAGGSLGLFATQINQEGTLRAPVGSITLGWDGTGTAPVDAITGTGSPSPVTTSLTLASGSVTSVSAVDPKTGEGVIIPYGISLDGTTWIDPAGNDITVRGVPGKTINLSASNVKTEKGSTLDISGGGNLYAYRWISGNGGTKDVLASSTSFAVIPGYSAEYSPYAPFNGNSSAANLGGEPGYVNSSLKVGDQITLAASKGLPAGTYTLLPARYALLPGAFLITPQGGTPVNPARQPGGSSLVSGYRSNNLDPSRSGVTNISRYEITSSKGVRDLAQYQDLLANTVLRESAIAREFAVPRLPVDAGLLSFSSTENMTLLGSVSSAKPEGGRGSMIDINSAADILINKSGRGGDGSQLVLSAGLLNSFGAESLLIGGLRSFGEDGAVVTVNSGNVTLDNAGAALEGEDVILVADKKLTLGKNSVIRGTGGNEELDTLVLGTDATAGSGDGTLVRVSGNSNASVIRSGVSSSTTPDLVVGAGVKLSGGGIMLDSTAGTRLNTSALLQGESVLLSSGQISIRLNKPGKLNPTSGLVLSGGALEGLQESARSLSLLSYSSLDVYGSGTVGSRSFESLALQAASIRGFNTGGGTASFVAKNLILENVAGSPASSQLPGGLAGTIRFDADQVTLGANDTRVDGFANTEISADNRILVTGDGSFHSRGALELISPLVTGGSASSYKISSAGLLSTSRPAGSSPAPQPGGFGAELVLEGARVRINSDIALPSGELTLHATSGDVVVGDLADADLDLSGTRSRLLDVTRYTSGGLVNLVSDKGNVRIEKLAGISVAADNGGGNAGGIAVKTPEGSFTLTGTIEGAAGNGLQGSFALDSSSIEGRSLASIDSVLNDGSFTRSRSYRIRSGDVKVDGSAISGIYQVSADDGNITVTGKIDASGTTGGTIDIKANGDLVIAEGVVLDASGDDFNAAGKGGAITLEAGAQRDGVIDSGATLDLREGALINLSVAARDSGSDTLGRFSGTLHLRAPRDAANKDVRIETIGSTIRGASGILVEGVKLYGVTGAGTITTAIQNSIRNDATAYLGASGTTTAGYTAMLERLTASNAGLDLILAPGVEIYNLNGNITLGTANSTATSDWNLSGMRFGERGAAGVLTLRASENLIFHNALSDGFSGGASLWLSPLMEYNNKLPANAQSWSMRLTAGADLSAASFREVRALDSLAAGSGVLQLGKNAGAGTVTGGSNARTSALIGNLFQVIRTGSGDIDINTGRSLQLLNPFASIYTAGTRVADPTKVSSANDFVVPILDRTPPQVNLGAAQQNYLAQYSMAGGNVTISAGENIERKTRNNSGLIDDSSRQLPNNWLYRRGLLDQNGEAGLIRIGTGLGAASDPAASTSWWVDFSNFFQGVGALGGGNITLTANQDVKNMDAVIPTNARAARGRPTASSFIELGGGDLRVKAGNDISGGVYYVERGHGTLEAGGSVTTNGTRSPSFGLVGNLNNPDNARLDPLTWMPTTLFVGKSSFDVTASGDLLLGPVSNPFLLPQGTGNRFWYKTYFSTISPDSELIASSLGGDVTFRNSVTLPGQNQAIPMLQAWHETQLLYTGSSSSTAWVQPWLRLAETSVAPFSPVWSLTASSLSLSSLSGDVNLAGGFTLFPASSGQLEIIAGGSVNALQPTGLSNILVAGRAVQSWTSATVNLSDADPDAVPNALSPLSAFASSSTGVTPSNSTTMGFMDSLASLFTESGSVTGANAVLQTRQGRHTQGGLHRDDDEPLRIYALGGNLSGLTLYSPKETRISASVDLTDVSLYMQNLSASDVSVVSAGRNIVAYNSSSPLRLTALSEGNSPGVGQGPLAGDIQIAGPGTLQVIAGGDIDLGIGANNADGTGTGITSIGNLRNPYLQAKGADLVVGAGIGPATSLANSPLALDAFIGKFVDTKEGRAYLRQIAPGVDFSEQSAEEQARLATEVFYRILRDTGRDFNDPDSDGYQNYKVGKAAVRTLFGKDTERDGDILTQGRDIRTKSGGNISILTPGGGLTMAETTLGNPLAPPGIITESGGRISLFADQDVSIGIGRIFTLRGGDVMIWSSRGDIAAGSSSRTVQSAPPTRVVVDPQSASVETDLAGLATGGGIGVLATVKGVEPGDVDLIAPSGVIDAGDAGIRVSGNINLAAVTVVNAANIQAGGNSSGTPSTSVSAPSISTVTAASNATAAADNTIAKPQENKPSESPVQADSQPSIITVEVIGYGGGSDEEDEEEEDGQSESAP